jgi:hypothetical protein
MLPPRPLHRPGRQTLGSCRQRLPGGGKLLGLHAQQMANHRSRSHPPGAMKELRGHTGPTQPGGRERGPGRHSRV